jgi:hypothetical protein
LVSKLTDSGPDPAVRKAIVEALGRLRGPAAGVALAALESGHLAVIRPATTTVCL